MVLLIFKAIARFDMILPREFTVYEDSQIFYTFFTVQIRQRICLVIKDTYRRDKGKTFLIRAEDDKI